MSDKSKVQKEKAALKRLSLDGVLKQNEAIKAKVSKAASELALVNDVLNHDQASEEAKKMALSQNAGAEDLVAKAADDLKRVNVRLANEIAARIGIESELDTVKSDLATVRDDLLQAQLTGREAQQLALTDSLTGLPNRACFDLALKHGLVQEKRQGWGLAVLFIDVNNFKEINDTYGHDVGDQVLLTIANRLQSSIRDGDMVSRWGGDEFVCLLLEVHLESDVLRLAGKLAQRVAEAVTFNNLMLQIKISIGIALSPADGEDADLLIKKADMAMYKAKHAARQIVLYRHLTKKDLGSHP